MMQDDTHNDDLDPNFNMSVDFGSEEADKVLVGIEIELSEYIQRIMTEKEISLRKLSKMTGLSPRTLTYHLNGNSENSLAKLLLISQKLGLTGTVTVCVKRD